MAQWHKRRWCPKGCGKTVFFLSGEKKFKFQCNQCNKGWESLLHFENSWKIKLGE